MRLCVCACCVRVRVRVRACVRASVRAYVREHVADMPQHVCHMRRRIHVAYEEEDTCVNMWPTCLNMWPTTQRTSP